MPWTKVMHEFKEGSLHSGKGGPVVTKPEQAVAIMLSEKRKAKAQSETLKSKHKGQVRAVKHMSGEGE